MSEPPKLERQTSESLVIPERRVVVKHPNELPSNYSETPGGTIFSTTPGGESELPCWVLYYYVTLLLILSTLPSPSLSLPPGPQTLLSLLDLVQVCHHNPLVHVRQVESNGYTILWTLHTPIHLSHLVSLQVKWPEHDKCFDDMNSICEFHTCMVPDS